MIYHTIYSIVYFELGGTLMAEKKASDWLSWFKIIIIALVFALVVRKFIFSPIIVEGPSMQPTLYSQDQMIVNKFQYYFQEPQRFDIIVFHASEQKDFIKRVIGLPGEHVAVKDDVLYIDHEPIDQSFLPTTSSNQNFFHINTADFSLEKLNGNYDTIPEGFIFVLGDNRHNSTDSRHNDVGLVPIDEVVGKTNVIYWPPSRIQIVK